MAGVLRRPPSAYFHILVLLLVQVGCGGGGGYPDTPVMSAIGREGTCVACGKKIDSVGRQNLITIDGIQFIVCSDACAEKAPAASEHSHSGPDH